MNNFKNFRNNSGNVSRERSLGDSNYLMTSQHPITSARQNKHNQTIDSGNPYAKYINPSVDNYNPNDSMMQSPDRSIHNNEFYSKCTNEKQEGGAGVSD